MSGFLFLRADRGQLAPPISATIYEGRIARVHGPGDGLVYATGPEHRDAEELAKLVTQLPQLPVYLGHPSVYPASDSGQKVVGYVESGRLDDDTLVARIVITDEETLAAIAAGTHELSLGYQCALDENRYQKNLKLDHLAVVSRARCGVACSMRTDMLETIPSDRGWEMPTDNVKMNEVSVKVEIDEATLKKVVDEAFAGVTVNVNTDCTCKNHTIPHTNGDTMSNTNDLAAEMAALNEKLEAANKALTALEIEATNARKDADKAKSELEAAQAEIVAAKSASEEAVAKVKSDAAEALTNEIQTRVDARVALLVEAKAVLPADSDISKLNDREIMCAVVKHIDGDDIAAEKSMDFVSGVYVGALKRGAGAGASRAAARVAINEMRQDGVKSPIELEKAAKENMKRASANAWVTK